MKYILKILFSLYLFSLTYGAYSQGHNPPQKIPAWYQFTATTNDSMANIPKFVTPSYYRIKGSFYLDTTTMNVLCWNGSAFVCLTCDSINAVNNGLSDSSKTAQLGQLAGSATNQARLYANREIPLNLHSFTLWDSLNSVSTPLSGYKRFNDTAHGSFVSIYPVQEINQADKFFDFYNWTEWRPNNYGTLYPSYKPNGALAKAMSFGFGYSQNSSGGLTMPDNVYGWGYNTDNGIGRRDTGDAAMSMRLETSFLVNGEPNFELHWPELIRFDGTMQRVNSWYMGKTTGISLWESNLDQHDYKRAVGTNPGGKWLQFTSNSGDFGSINLFGTHNNSIEGIISFTDSNGVHSQIRGNEGRMEFLASSVGESEYMDTDGSMYFNFSQNAAVSNGTTIVGNYPSSIPSNHASAQLKVISTTRGFLPPQMTTTQKLAISNPAEGLQVYDLTLHQMSYYNGTTWINF